MQVLSQFEITRAYYQNELLSLDGAGQDVVSQALCLAGKTGKVVLKGFQINNIKKPVTLESSSKRSIIKR